MGVDRKTAGDGPETAFTGSLLWVLRSHVFQFPTQSRITQKAIQCPDAHEEPNIKDSHSYEPNEKLFLQKSSLDLR